jgi:hypothetical protein
MCILIEILILGAELFRLDGRTDGRTDITKLTVALRKSANAPRKEQDADE